MSKVPGQASEAKPSRCWKVKVGREEWIGRSGTGIMAVSIDKVR